MSLVLSNIGKAFGDASLIDDGVDRFHRKFMVSFLAVVCVILGGKQFVGDPIHCFLTSDVSSQSDYINSYCWTASTYQILPDEDDPFDPFRQGLIGDKKNGDRIDNTGKGTKKFISYYQWIPIVLCLQSVSFYIPYLIWRNLAKNSGLHLPNLMKGIYELAKVQTNDKSREFILKDASSLINQYLKTKTRNLSLIPSLLVFSFFTGKLLYTANVFFQLWALHSFLQTNILAHSFEITKKFIFEHDWTSSPRFPIRTLCQFSAIPQMGNYLTTHTTHCVLPINLYNDKIYAVIALLMLFGTVLSVFALLSWGFKLFAPMSKDKLVIKRLQAQKVNPKHSEKANDFVNKHLGYDGRFILYLVDRNVGSVVCECLIDSLWEMYKEENHFTPEGSIHSEVDLNTEEKTELYPNGKLASLRCPNCQTLIPGNREGANCPQCGKVVDY